MFFLFLLNLFTFFTKFSENFIKFLFIFTVINVIGLKNTFFRILKIILKGNNTILIIPLSIVFMNFIILTFKEITYLLIVRI